MPRSLRIGLTVFILFLSFLIWGYFSVPVSVDCPDQTVWSERAPEGAIWERETIHWDHIPPGYTTLVGWVNVATALPCAGMEQPQPAVELRSIRILTRDTSGVETVLTEIDPRDKTRFVGRLFPRAPAWFGETEGEGWMNIATLSAEALNLRIGRVPLRIYHGWTEPRLVLDPAQRYRLEVEAKITGSARLQFGIDYWRDAKSDYAGWDAACVHSTNCEGWVSDWQSDTADAFRIFRAPEGQ